MYQRDPFPETWARMHGKGRVFFTSMGHREDVWQKPEYLALLVGAMNWVTGRVEADVKPNIKEVTPGADPKPFPKEEKK
jgi:type 1 glutamine amidotransferase